MERDQGSQASANHDGPPPYNTRYSSCQSPSQLQHDFASRNQSLELSRDDMRPLIRPHHSAEGPLTAQESREPAIPLASACLGATAPHHRAAKAVAGHVSGDSNATYEPLSDRNRHSTDSSRSSALWSAPGRADSKPEMAHQESELVCTSRQSWKTTFLGWLPELTWCLVSIASVAALAGVLCRFDGQRLPEWPLGLTLNTLIAFLATLARAAFVVPVSEGLSQLKWLWFRKPRSLKDFQDFDSASRGPWGSIQLLKTTKGWSPTLISTIVLITAIFTSTLTQSAVTYPVRLARVDGTAIVSRSTSYYFNTANLYSGMRHKHYIDQSIFEAMSYDHTQEFPLSPAQCSTSECRWRAYSSLSVCSKFWNVTEFLNVTTKQKAKPPLERLVSLPNGVSANLSGYYQGLVSLSGMDETIASDLDYESSLFNFTVIYSLDSGARIGAAEAVLYFCVKTYNLTFAGNLESREQLKITVDLEEGSVELPSGQGIRELPALGDPLEPGTNFPYGGTGLGSMQESLMYTLNGSYADLSGDQTALALAPARYWAALQYGADTLESQGRPNVSAEVVINESIGNITNNIARSLSNRIAQDTMNVTGEALASETFVLVRWPWLAFISSQVALSIVLLALAIIKTKAAGIGVVKSSALPALVAIDSKDKQVLEKRLASQAHQDEVDGMARRGRGIAWKLSMMDRGWALRP